MNISVPSPSFTRSRLATAILLGGLVAGILDLSFAITSFILRGKSTAMLLKVIAGGALGREALQGGPGTAALGVVFHFCVSFGAAAVYCAGSRMLPFLNRHAFLSGLVYGLLVYEFMNLVVLPLSAYHKPFAPPPLFVPDVLSHLFFVGLPIALIAKHQSSRSDPT